MILMLVMGLMRMMNYVYLLPDEQYKHAYGEDEEEEVDAHLAVIGVQFQVAMCIKREIAVWRGQGQTGGTK